MIFRLSRIPYLSLVHALTHTLISVFPATQSHCPVQLPTADMIHKNCIFNNMLGKKMDVNSQIVHSDYVLHSCLSQVCPNIFIACIYFYAIMLFTFYGNLRRMI